MNTAEPTTSTVRPTFDQIIEFPCSMPTINLTIVAAEAAEDGVNWTRDPSLAVSAFCVHSGGVDQINIAQDAFDSAAAGAAAKLPNISFGPLSADRSERRVSSQSQNSVAPPQQAAPQVQQPLPPQQQQQQQMIPQQRPDLIQMSSGSYATPQQQQMPVSLPNYAAPRSLTPPGEPLNARYEMTAPAPAPAPVQQQQVAGKAKGKEQASGKQTWKSSPLANPTEPSSSKIETEALATGLTKEIRKVEENLHTKIGRLIVKELDKQRQWSECLVPNAD